MKNYLCPESIGWACEPRDRDSLPPAPANRIHEAGIIWGDAELKEHFVLCVPGLQMDKQSGGWGSPPVHWERTARDTPASQAACAAVGDRGAPCLILCWALPVGGTGRRRLSRSGSRVLNGDTSGEMCVFRGN